MSDHSPCIKLNQSNWTVDGAGEPVDCDERSGHPDDEEVLNDEYELPNIDVYDILEGAAPIIGKYLSLLGGDAETNTLIAKSVIEGVRFYQEARGCIAMDDKAIVMTSGRVFFSKLYDVARALHVSKEAKKEEERKAHEEGLKYREDRCKIVEGQIAARKEEQKEEYRQVVRETVEEVLRQQLASMKTSPVTDLY